MPVADLTSPVAIKSTIMVTKIDIHLQAITFFKISPTFTYKLQLFPAIPIEALAIAYSA
tara:strand:- start:140 stop:316 length:177 start_codon:yes stop_codon:yes gene_type:complete